MLSQMSQAELEQDVQEAGHNEERVQIGSSFDDIPHWRFVAGLPLIYFPILIGIVPMILCALLVRAHLRMVGACNLKTYWKDFVPSWVSHRYTRKRQIVSDHKCPVKNRINSIGFDRE